jgi:surface antigen
VARGHWVARLTCRKGKNSATSRRLAQAFTVRGPKREHPQSLVKSGSLRVAFRVNAPKVPIDRGNQDAGKGGGFQYCQCTWYADYRRPDIYSYAVRHGVSGSGWDGKAWAAKAAAAGELTGDLPQPGALVSWQPGGRYPTNPTYGHVAYVESVGADGRSFTTTEMSGGHCGTSRAGTVYTGRYTAPAPGMKFIYGPPGSPTPGGGGPTARDLQLIKTRNTGSGHVEVHSATAGSGYQAAGPHSVSWLSPGDAGNGWFQMVGADLFFIKTKNTGDGHVEVHSATAGSGYKQAAHHAVSWMSSADANNGWFQMVGPDLFFIKTKNTGSGHVEVHSATAGSGYKNAAHHAVTWFSPADANNGWFQMVGPDLFFIKTKNTGSGHVEVHSATAGSGYKSAGQHSVSWLSPGDASNGWFQVAPGGDLFFIKTRNTGSGRVEIHSATAASGYQSAGLHSTSWLSPADASNGWFQVAGTKG